MHATIRDETRVTIETESADSGDAPAITTRRYAKAPSRRPIPAKVTGINAAIIETEKTNNMSGYDIPGARAHVREYMPRAQKVHQLQTKLLVQK
jgi:hypothetical protein